MSGVNIAKAKSEEKILEALLNASPRGLRWGNLVEKTGLSKRTLNKRLIELEKRGIIGKYIDVKAGSYPPPVIYFLREGAFTSESYYFTNFSIQSLSNLYLALGKAMEKDELLKVFGRTIAALSSYMVIEAMLSDSKEKADRWLHLLNYEMKEMLFQELSKRLIYESGGEMTAGELFDKGKLLELIPKNRVNDLKTVLKEIYPEEVELFELIKMVAAAWVEIRDASRKGEIDKELLELPWTDFIKVWIAWRGGRLGSGPLTPSTAKKWLSHTNENSHKKKSINRYIRK